MRFITAILGAISIAVLSWGALAQGASEDSDASGYIFVTGWYKDAGVQRQYGRAVGPVLRDFGFQKSVFGLEGQNLRVIEGDWIPGRVLMIKFPSGNHVKRFWWSKAYQEVREIRASTSAVDIAQVDGVPGVKSFMSEESAYLVFLADITDRKTLMEDYGPNAPKLVKKHGGQFIIRAGRAAMGLLEGDIPNASLVVVEFPNVDAMNAFWNDPEYKRLSEIRKATGKWSVAELVPNPR